MMSAIQHFLLVFDHGKNELIKTLRFGEDAQAATKCYGEFEKKYRDSSLIDIVLVGSDSLETVKVTHSIYFTGTSERKVHDALTNMLGV